MHYLKWLFFFAYCFLIHKYFGTCMYGYTRYHVHSFFFFKLQLLISWAHVNHVLLVTHSRDFVRSNATCALQELTQQAWRTRIAKNALKESMQTLGKHPVARNVIPDCRSPLADRLDVTNVPLGGLRTRWDFLIVSTAQQADMDQQWKYLCCALYAQEAGSRQ